jgi:Ni,Fe-hydrogenase III large subunit
MLHFEFEVVGWLTEVIGYEVEAQQAVSVREQVNFH